MKKLTAVCLIVAAFISLCGCSAKEAIASDKQEYIVASMGFDNINGKIKMLIEAIVVNTDDLSEDKKSVILSGVGNTIAEAFDKITAQITQPLSLGHNAVTAIGSKASDKQLDEILRFCREKTQINLAAMLVFTNNAENLLCCEAASSIAVGYDIMSMIEVVEEQRGTVFKNRLYEVAALRQKPMETFYMPYMAIQNEKPVLNGLAVFKKNKNITKLSNEEVPIFCLITDSLARGEIVVNGKSKEIRYSKASYKFDFDQKLNITVNIRIKSTGDNKVLEGKAEELLRTGDIFSLGNIIYQKEQKIWERIKNDYQSYFKNADIRVNIYE